MPAGAGTPRPVARHTRFGRSVRGVRRSSSPLDNRAEILTAAMPASANTASNEAVNCPARSRTRNRNRAVRWPRSMTRLRTCCVVQGPSGCAVTPRRAGSDQRSRARTRRRAAPASRVVDVKEVDGHHAGRLRAQELAPAGVGVPHWRRWIRRRRRIRRIVEAPTRWPSLSSSPSTLGPRHPIDQRGEGLERVPRILTTGCGRPSRCCIVMI
jgi:hypothetical protein